MDEADRLVAIGMARWDGEDLVYVNLPAPLTHNGKPVPASAPARVRFVGTVHVASRLPVEPARG